jgi:hypothetical protein
MVTVVASHLGPYSLLHRPSGAIRIFASVQDAAAAIQALGIRRLVEDASPEWAFHVGNRWSSLCYPPQIGLHWQLTNVYGETVGFDDLAPWFPPVRRRKVRPENIARHRIDPVPRTGRWGRSVYFRQPRTLAALREAASCDDTEAPVRATRRVHMLPTAWDDRDRNPERNWKSQRRTQWKEGRRRIGATP